MNDEGGGVTELSRLFAIDWARGTDVTIEEAIVRLALAVVLSAAVGIDRELRHKPLGLRTNMMVALGAAGCSLMALHLVDLLEGSPQVVQIDPVRVMEAVVGAIGFLGAAAIIQGRFEVVGATTGASIWVVGALGMACGFGFYGLAISISAIGLLVLTVLGFFTRNLAPTHDTDRDAEEPQSAASNPPYERAAPRRPSSAATPGAPDRNTPRA
jgi:putative Mg2+ transporter-C (MgtC) family protein